MTNIIELGEYSEKIQKALRSILKNGSSLVNLNFGANAEEKKLLFFYGFPDKKMLDSLCSASIAISEPDIYIIRLSMYASENNLDPSVENCDSHMRQSYRSPFLWKLSCDFSNDLYGDDVPQELKSIISIEYAIISQNGRWGVIKPIGPIAFLAGEKEYFKLLFEEAPELNNQVFDFLKYVKNMYDEPNSQLNMKSIRDTLKCIYDEKKANILFSSIFVA